MLKYTKEITTPSAYALFSKYALSEEEIQVFVKSLAENEEESIERFLQAYLQLPTEEYSELVAKYMVIAEQGELTAANKNKIERSVIALTTALISTLKNNFDILAEKLYGPIIFTERDITVKKVQKAILDATAGQFNTLTEKSLLSTQADVLAKVRRMQRELITFNQGRGRLTGASLDRAVKNFTDTLKARFPSYYKMADGKLFSTSPFGENGIVRYYKLEDYVNMSVRTTLLNIDRTSTEVIVTAKEDQREIKGRTPVRVVEFYKRDNRTIKTKEREICQHILASRKYGKPLLALDEETASLLKIMSVREAENTPDYSFGVGCRHSIKPISVALRKELEVIIKKKQEAL